MKFLIIQTAFLGDVILATAVVEKLHQRYPDAQIDFVLRKGNEGLLANHPFIKNVFAWNKKQSKIKNLLSIVKKIKANKYDYALTIHRFASSGLLLGLSGAQVKIGFDKNPLSYLFTKKIKHIIGDGRHEVERNQQLIESITDAAFAKPKLYPSKENYDAVNKYKFSEYYCIAPTSVWFTKQFPKQKWVELINALPYKMIYLLGASADYDFCEELISQVSSEKQEHCVNLAGKLNFLESAALMKDAKMNYVNDSGPLHIASAMNAPTTAIYCSTIPAFGFGPLSEYSKIVETQEKLDCRPCGLHGHAACPLGHFKCAYSIDIKELLPLN